MNILIPIIIFILILVFWCTQFLKLMKMKADEFTSREDKAIWAVLMIFLNALGALIFWIQFRPEREVFIQLHTDIYVHIKQIFPDHLAEIDSALSLDSYKRFDLEKYYGKKSPSELATRYRSGSKDIRSECFGVLLAVLTSRQIEI